MEKITFPSYNINEIFNALNSRFFNNNVTSSVRWAATSWRSKWGHYDSRKREIVINPIMKKSPTWVVASTVYHEMLHEAIPSHRNPLTNRWVRHGSEFKRREKLYPYYQKSKKWKKENSNLIVCKLYHTFDGFNVGQIIESFNGKKFEITGFKPRNWKYPIIAKSIIDNKIYKLSKNQIVSSYYNVKIIKKG